MREHKPRLHSHPRRYRKKTPGELFMYWFRARTYLHILTSPYPSEKVFVSQERVSGFPEQGLTSGEVRGTSGEVWGTSGEVWGTSGEPLDCLKIHSERSSGEVAEKLPGKFGELPEKSGDFPEVRGSLTPSQRLAKFVSKPRPPPP